METALDKKRMYFFTMEISQKMKEETAASPNSQRSTKAPGESKKNQKHTHMHTKHMDKPISMKD